MSGALSTLERVSSRCVGVRAEDARYSIEDPRWWAPAAWAFGAAILVVAALVALRHPGIFAGTLAFAGVCWLLQSTRLPATVVLGPKRLLVPARFWNAARYAEITAVRSDGRRVLVHFTPRIGRTRSGFGRCIKLVPEEPDLFLRHLFDRIEQDQGREFAAKLRSS